MSKTKLSTRKITYQIPKYTKPTLIPPDHASHDVDNISVPLVYLSDLPNVGQFSRTVTTVLELEINFKVMIGSSLSSDSDALTPLLNYLYDNGYTSSANACLDCVVSDESTYGTVKGLYATKDTNNKISVCFNESGKSDYDIFINSTVVSPFIFQAYKTEPLTIADKGLKYVGHPANMQTVNLRVDEISAQAYNICVIPLSGKLNESSCIHVVLDVNTFAPNAGEIVSRYDTHNEASAFSLYMIVGEDSGNLIAHRIEKYDNMTYADFYVTRRMTRTGNDYYADLKVEGLSVTYGGSNPDAVGDLYTWYKSTAMSNYNYPYIVIGKLKELYDQTPGSTFNVIDVYEEIVPIKD